MSASLGFSTIKNSLNRALSYQKDVEILMSVAAIVTLLTEKWQVYLFAREIFTTQQDKVTPLAESSFLIIAPPSVEDTWL